MHSFKGGAGRSVTTGNVATALARDFGKRVLIIDLDLESAGTSVLFDVEERSETDDFNSVQGILGGENVANLGRDKFEQMWRNSHCDIPLMHGRVEGGWLKVMPSLQILKGHQVRTSFSTADTRSFGAFLAYLNEILKYDILLVDSPSGTQGPALFGLQFCDHLCEFVRWSRQFIRGATRFIMEFNEREERKDSSIQSILVIPVAVPSEMPEDPAVLRSLCSRAGLFVKDIEEASRKFSMNHETDTSRIRLLGDAPPGTDFRDWSNIQRYLSGISENPILKWDDVVFGTKRYERLTSTSASTALDEYRSLAQAILAESEEN
ncbi:MAG: AAA family ATPase [Alphaproteobacteria bacterium]|nr:AAA family ATPase [Alphaproteobacteria bacterium]